MAPQRAPVPSSAFPTFLGGGETGALIRAFPWETTPLGPPAAWPATLHTTLRLVLASRHPMLLLWGPRLVQFYNDAYAPTLGPARHPGGIGQCAEEFWTENWAYIGPELRGVLERGEATWHQDRMVPFARDGRVEEAYWTYSYSPVHLPDGAVGGVLVVCTETTDRVRLGARVDAETARRARLVHDMPGPFFAVDAAWRLTDLNPAAERALSLRAADLVGRSLWEAFPGLVGSRFEESYRRARRDGVRVATTDYYPDFERWYEAHAFPFGDGIAVSFFDVTEHKRVQQRLEEEKRKLEAIFYGSASPLVLFRGPELVYEAFNAGYAGLVPRRALAGRPLLEALPELAGSPFPKLIRQVFDDGVTVTTREEVAPLADPETGEVVERYFDSTISRVGDGVSEPYGVVVQATDVTDRVHARRRIEQAHAVRDSFLSVASHELRTPITSLVLRSELLLRQFGRDAAGPPPERLAAFARQVHAGLRRLSRLVDDMLDVSRIQGDRLSLECAPAELGAFARQVFDYFASELADAGIAVTLAAGAPVPVHVDALRLEQVLANLVTNVVRYAPGAPVTVEVAQVDGRARLTFEDGGPGIPEADRERVFQRYERLVSARHVSGLGVGLYIARELVRAHGGELSVEEGRGGGARFVVDLPLAGHRAP